jgi:hypothetical protein
VTGLSLTLRDAQHLCWKTFRKLELMNQKASEKSGAKGELVKKAEEIALKISDSQGASDKESAAKMLSELLYYAFVVAEQQSVDLEEGFLQTVDEMILGSVT